MKKRQPWFQFYPQDWRGDQALRMVSLTARGLWIECLTVMHEATPYGHLVVNGRPLGVDVLARMVGATGEEVRSCLTELEESGVYDVTGKGVIFSRRMVRDQERRTKLRKNGAKGGNPTLRKQTTKAPLVNQGDNTKDKPHIPEAIGHKDIGEISATDLGAMFKRFWQAYGESPNKGGDVPSIQAFKRRLDAGEDPESLILSAAAYRAERPDGKFVGRASKFLDEGEYRNFLPKAVNVAAPETPEQWRRRVDFYQQHSQWHAPGPKPGEPGCLAPPEILTACGYRPAVSLVEQKSAGRAA